MRQSILLAFLLAPACASQTEIRYPAQYEQAIRDMQAARPASTEPSSPPPEAVPQRVQRSPAVLARYQTAVADRMRDPEATRFRRTSVVRHPLSNHDALCGEVNAKNAYGGYVGYDAFYAPIIEVGGRAVAFVRTSEKEGHSVIADQCGESGKAVRVIDTAAPSILNSTSANVSGTAPAQLSEVSSRCTGSADVSICRYAMAARYGLGPSPLPGTPAEHVLTYCRDVPNVPACIHSVPPRP